MYAPGVAGFILGTDNAGRDILSRLMHGARFTLGLALGLTVAGFQFLAEGLRRRQHRSG